MISNANAPPVEYAELSAALEQSHAPVSASEGHGVLTGLLCAPEALFDEEGHLRELLGNPEPGDLLAEEARGLLLASFEHTGRLLGAGELAFSPLLPADSEPINARVSALADWCTGFLAGIGLGAGDSEQMMHADVREALADLAEFAKLDPRARSNETEEEAYSELVEYVRVAVMLVREHLRPPASDERELLH